MSDQIKTCKGYTKSHNLCNENVINNTEYCEYHQYYVTYTPHQYQLIVNSDNNVKHCGKCGKWHFGEKNMCDRCRTYQAEQRQAKNNERGKCRGKTEDGEPCPKYGFNGTKVCEYHSWMKDFTDDQFANQHLYPHPDKVKCYGVSGAGNNCNHKPVSKENIYCDDHQYYHKYTPEEMNSIKSKDGKFKSCGKKGHWKAINEDTCRICKPRYDARNEKRSAEGGKKCIVMTDVDGTKQCERYAIEGHVTCARHLDRVDEIGVAKPLYLCSTCIVVRSNAPNTQCSTCEEERSIMRSKLSAKRKETLEPCKLCDKLIELDSTYEFKDFCGKHQGNAWFLNLELNNKKGCSNYIRGCRTELTENDLKYKRCRDCRAKYA